MDLEVVPTAALADVIIRWIEAWREDRPWHNTGVTGNRWSEPDSGFYSSTTWLAENSGVNERVIRRIMEKKYKFTNLQTADKLLTALNLGHYLARGGPIPVVANPFMSLETWQQNMRARGCCDDDPF